MQNAISTSKSIISIAPQDKVGLWTVNYSVVDISAHNKFVWVLPSSTGVYFMHSCSYFKHF